MKTEIRIKKQVEAAEALVNQINGVNTSEETQPEVVNTTDESNTDVVQQPEAEEIQTSEVSPEEPAAQPEMEPSQTFDPTSEVDWQKRAEAAEQRYRVLQGKYNKEIVEKRDQPKADNSEVMQLKQEIESLKRIIATQPKESEPLEQSEEIKLPQSERIQNLRDDYGNELVDGLLMEFGEITKQTVQQTQQQLQQTVDTFKQDSFATKKSMVSQLLAGQRINFEQVNNDPVFHDWLSKFDVDTGVQRQQKLTSMFESGDLHSVANMFAEFVNGGSQPQPQSVDFSEHVQQPTHAPQIPADTQNTRPVYTPQMIKDFYANKRKGRYTPEEAQRIEREIFASMKR
ncbi:TPA: hypothetical protein ACRZZI_004966 [Vibrio harveyi]